MEKDKNTLVIKCSVDTKEIDIALEKANKLKKLLQEVNELIHEISNPQNDVTKINVDNVAEKFVKEVEKYEKKKNYSKD